MDSILAVKAEICQELSNPGIQLPFLFERNESEEDNSNISFVA